MLQHILHQTWWSAVMPAMLILLTSMSTLALRSSAMIAIPSLSLMLSSKTTSSGNRTLRLPGFCRAKTLALRDIAVALGSSATFANMQLRMCFLRLPAQADTWSHCLHKFCLLLPTVCSKVSLSVSTGWCRAPPPATFAPLLARWLGSFWARVGGWIEPALLQGGAGWTRLAGAVSHLSMALGAGQQARRPSCKP